MHSRLRLPASITVVALAFGSLIGCEGEKPSTAINNAAEGLKGATDAAAKKAGEVADAVAADVKEGGLAAARETATKAAQSAIDSVKSSVASVKTKVASLSEPVKAQAQSLVTQVESALQSAEGKLSEFKNAAADKIPTITAEISKVVENAKAKLGELTKLVPAG